MKENDRELYMITF